MTSKMKKCVFLMVHTNMKQGEIAKEIAVNESTISRWKQREDFKTFKGQEERAYLNELTSPALRSLKRLLNAESEQVQLNAARDVLDRTGYKPSEIADLIGAGLNLNIKVDYGEYPEE